MLSIKAFNAINVKFVVIHLVTKSANLIDKYKERALMLLNSNCIRKVAEFIDCSVYIVVRWIRAFANYNTKRVH